SDPPPIYVTGLVYNNGPVEYPVGKTLRVLDAVSLAGGLRNQLADKIYVIRKVAGSDDPAVIQVSHQRAKHHGEENIVLAPGDVVSIEQTAATVFLDMFQIIRLSISGSTGVLF
ncbi:MAG: hypothetical protein KDA96_00080, partial [Planctomycetaceae bacterium]|nr:hypothetical protein [Planctomycetaceae bacterium]